MKKSAILCSILFLFLISTSYSALGQETTAPKPSKKDKCPVCGMFVYRYPDWVATVKFENGPTLFFDGTKDMFKYLFDIGKYDPNLSRDDVHFVFVTEYYDMKNIDGRQAYFVMGSDVYGPMGKELIPFATMEDAEEFKTDHKGNRILRWDDVTPAIIGRLD